MSAEGKNGTFLPGRQNERHSYELSGRGTMGRFYTIGYGGRRPEDLLALLKSKGIRTVVDVRLHPYRASMGVYTKASSADKGIEKLLAGSGIKYRWLAELGNLFFHFEDWRSPYRLLLERAGDLLTQRLMQIREPFCLMCSERKASECHRGEIANCLVKKGWEVEHIE